MKFKKLLLPGFAALLALGLVACSDEGSDNNVEDKEDKQEESVDKDKVVTYTQPSEINEKFKNGETFAFVIGNANCGACQQYKAEALKDLSKEEGISLPFIETLGIEKNKEEHEQFKSLIKDNLGDQFEATPTTYFVVDGKLKETIVGSMPYGSLLEYLDLHVGLDSYKEIEEVKDDEAPESDTSGIESKEE